jgi:DNA-binding NarL/FixJ family response regulator
VVDFGSCINLQSTGRSSNDSTLKENTTLAEMLGDNRKRLILIDDHILVRQGLERLLNLGDKFVVCEETGDAATGLELVRELRPDGVIGDGCLRHGTDGIDLTKKLLDEFPAIVVVILSAHDDPKYIRRAAKAGALAYVLKSALFETLQLALCNAFNGKLTFRSEILDTSTRRMGPTQVGFDIALDLKAARSSS